jgi:hypothetical protein
MRLCWFSFFYPSVSSWRWLAWPSGIKRLKKVISWTRLAYRAIASPRRESNPSEAIANGIECVTAGSIPAAPSGLPAAHEWRGPLGAPDPGHVMGVEVSRHIWERCSFPSLLFPVEATLPTPPPRFSYNDFAKSAFKMTAQLFRTSTVAVLLASSGRLSLSSCLSGFLHSDPCSPPGLRSHLDAKICFCCPGVS